MPPFQEIWAFPRLCYGYMWVNCLNQLNVIRHFALFFVESHLPTHNIGSRDKEATVSASPKPDIAITAPAADA